MAGRDFRGQNDKAPKLVFGELCLELSQECWVALSTEGTQNNAKYSRTTSTAKLLLLGANLEACLFNRLVPDGFHLDMVVTFFCEGFRIGIVSIKLGDVRV